MKVIVNVRYIHLLIFALIISGSFASNNYPKKSANPWKDDYRDISGLENYKSWGTYNVHDPSVLRSGDTYYMYSTDAIYFVGRPNGKRPDVKTGNIQVRSSKDLVQWRFEGWAFDSIPQEAKAWVLSHSDNKGATNIWAPYPVHYKDVYRLYYCVSAFGLQTSYIGFVESKSPLGPWIQKGSVIKTQRGDRMNAIDPSVVTDPTTGKMWMHYGSYFGGLFAVEINPETGLTATPNDQGHNIARRANPRRDNIEAPEIIYNPALKKYYLFTSYDPLMTTYNVRVGRADNPEGPFLDFFGNNLTDTINHYPILTHPYRFENHTGWAGTGHCAVFSNEKGDFFMAHQGRLSPENELMDLHLREVKWTTDGWPVVSPERYSGSKMKSVSKNDIPGEWEIIRVQDAKSDRNLEFGQIMWGEGQLRKTEVDVSKKLILDSSGKLNSLSSHWKFSEKTGLTLILQNETISNLIVFVGHDWENEAETLLFTGLDKNGCSVWGKRVK
jgi:arabinan endo-1,5-alpha-L-arabinosidase